MDSIKHLVISYEKMTAGRFYNIDQKQKLFDFACQMYMLSKEDCQELKNIVFSSDIENYNDITDCSNGLLMEVAVQKQFRKAILTARRDALKTIEQKMLWKSKTTWLQFINTTRRDYSHDFEKAIFNLVKGDFNAVKNQLSEYVESCDLFSILATSVIFRDAGDCDCEYKCLLLYKEIVEKLYFESLSPAFVSRIAYLSKICSESIACLVNQIVLTYFDEQSESIGRIGF